MRTRAQAWAIRAAVVAVVTAASVVGITTPAYAQPMIVNFTLSTNTIDPGQQVTASWTVRTNEADGENVDVSVSSNNQQVQCTGGQCSVVGAAIVQDGTDFTATFTATGVFTNQTTVQIRVTAGGVQSNAASLTVRSTPTVPEVRGTVTDLSTGQPVKDARVSMTDSVGTTWDNIGTGDDGSFTIPSTAQKPIAAGQVRFTVTKDGIDPFTSGTFNAVAGQPLTNVSLRVQVRATASATSLPPITATGLVTETPGTSTVAAPPDTGLSGFSIMLIVVGGLLVLVGIAAIVLLFVRRNNDDGEGPPRGGPPGVGGRGGPGRGGPPPGQRRPGPPDRTQPMRPGYGPPRPGAPGSRDQTMIARSPLADAPTQMHGRPGPPQAPYSGPPAYPPQQPGYGPPGGHGQPPGYGGGPPGGYPQQGPGGGQPGYGQPRPAPGGYDDPRQAGRHTTEGRRVDWMDD
jgi:hypothetical protein